MPPTREALSSWSTRQVRQPVATQEGGFSRYNESTARLCAELAVQAVHDGIDSVAIITPYVEQSRRIRRLLP